MSEILPAELAVCPDCGSTKTKLIGLLPTSESFAGRLLCEPVDGGGLFRCMDCCLKFRSPSPSEAFRNDSYDNAFTGSWSDNASPRVDWKLINALIQQKAVSRARVLDIGCYRADF